MGDNYVIETSFNLLGILFRGICCSSSRDIAREAVISEAMRLPYMWAIEPKDSRGSLIIITESL